MKEENLFNWIEYLTLNPDIQVHTYEEALKHWNSPDGKERMRLCNFKQLEVVNEFGCEIILYIPYYNYLYQNNLLFNNKITTYKGMDAFYIFLKDKLTNVNYVSNNRTWINSELRPLLVNDDEISEIFDWRYISPPDYRSYYSNNVFVYNKPLLVICNKYNIEWGLEVFNYINGNMLDTIFNDLSEKYQIIYIRPSKANTCYGFSIDNNEILSDPDDTIILSKYDDKVINFDSLCKQYKDKYDYNTLKLMILSNCTNYISCQGGGCHLLSYFFQKLVIWHCNGQERYLKKGFYYKYNSLKDKILIKSKKK